MEKEIKKPSDRIDEIFKELNTQFRNKQPFFAVDNGYWPSFETRAIIQYLDEKFSELK